MLVIVLQCEKETKTQSYAAGKTEQLIFLSD